MSDVWIYFENGLFLQAKSFGAEGISVGEIVFNTSLSGYQEIVSDPSYAGQFVLMTMPEIGIVGANAQDMESRSLFCKGLIVRSYNHFHSSFRAEESLDSLLKREGCMGISHIDTRALTKMIRDEGSMMMVASTTISSKEQLAEILRDSPKIEEIDYTQEVTTKESYIHNFGAYSDEEFCYKDRGDSLKRVVAIDFGIKRNILNELTEAGAVVEVVSCNFDPKELISRYNNKEIDAIFLSNGPGDPLVLKSAIEKIRELIDANISIFGICLGHQLLSIAHGYETKKLKFGHHGGNHPVKDSYSNMVQITSQNHNYSVPESIKEIADITHINLFDNTIEGIKYRDKNIFSLQHHPEASPGPRESKNIFCEFIKSI